MRAPTARGSAGPAAAAPAAGRSAPRWVAGAIRVRVPATSANLGPGYDAFGLALGLFDEVRARVTAGGLVVTIEGEGAGTVPADETNLVARAMMAAFDRLGGRPPGIELSCANHIPHSRGLGSSAAAIVAGVLAARGLVIDGRDRLDDAAVLTLATKLEGHPDNVAACLFGGFTVAWLTDERPRVLRLSPHQALRAVVLVPAAAVSTASVRALLPATVPHSDAAHNAARAGLLVAALTSRPDLLLPATEDRLHQGYRAPAMPATAAQVAALRAQRLPAVVSGAGPTVLTLVDEGDVGRVLACAADGFTASVLAVEDGGATVSAE